MTYFLGLDVSTTASKAIIMNNHGDVVASHTVLHESFSVPNEPLWSEQNPELWWEATADAIKTALKTVPNVNITAMALTGQMHGLVILDEHKKPLRKAILWNDQRSSKHCETLNAQYGYEFLCQHIGSKSLPCQLLPKLLWIKENEPDIYARIAHVITPKDYVRFCLSGVLAVDESDASGFALMDMKKREWCSHLLETQNIPSSWLPRIFVSTDICAHVNAFGAEKTGLSENTPIAAGAGDQPAQSVGCGMVSVGVMSLQIGTSGVVTQIGHYAPADDGCFLEYCHVQKDQWIGMGLTAAAAGSFRWFRDHIAVQYSFQELDTMAAKIPRGSEGLIFIPDICGNIHPNADALARGHFLGFTERHTIAHMARAVLEGVAFSLREVADIMCHISHASPESYMISGGAANSPLWKMIFAEIMQKPLYTVNTNEGAALGAAIIAGVGVGHWSTLEEACQLLVKKTETIEPTDVGKKQYQALYKVWQTAYPILKEMNHALADVF